MAKNLISSSIWACLAEICAPKVFSWILLLIDIRYCRKLSSYSVSRKTYDPNSTKWGKTLLWAWFTHVGPTLVPPFLFFKNMVSSVTRYHGQLSSCKISENKQKKAMIQYWKKLLTKGWKDGPTDTQTDRRTRVIS